MDPEQTSNKQHPYMCSFPHPHSHNLLLSYPPNLHPSTGTIDSQCQAIHCRSLFPCQDTPFIKSTYHCTIRSPLPVVVSGISLSTQSLGDGRMEYSFHQKIPIPSYLYAIASGDISSAKIGPRSSLWTGPGELEACQKELDGDTEKFIETAEVRLAIYTNNPTSNPLCEYANIQASTIAHNLPLPLGNLQCSDPPP